ncbi:MAG: acyl-CoA thioesterase [Propionibacteriaceae bacterium]|nr:acyl-CoA thioesterase [Propionibacteriaceae bacterium]
MNLYIRLLLLRVLSTFRPRAGLWQTSRTPFRVMPTDLDVLGHMNNGKFLTLMDLGRLDLMLRTGMWQKLTKQGWYPVVAGQSITYRRSLNPFQKFDLYTRLVGYEGPWIYVEQQFCVGETLYAQAVVRARFLRKGGGSVDPAEVAALASEPDAGGRVPQWMVAWTAATKPPTQFHPADAV